MDMEQMLNEQKEIVKKKRVESKKMNEDLKKERQKLRRMERGFNVFTGKLLKPVRREPKVPTPPKVKNEQTSKGQ